MPTRLTQAELITQRLTPRLGYIQRVQAFNHAGRHISATVVKFPYDKWLADPAPVYRLNGAIVTPNSADTDEGNATITALDPGDDVTATYTFSYFSTSDLEDFYDLALSRYNNVAPLTSHEYSTVPVESEYFITLYAYKMCLETILVDLMGWRARLIWSDPSLLATIVQGILSNINQEITAMLLTLKGRKGLLPKSISLGRYSTPSQISDSTWQRYTTIRTS